jgi:DNA modification methylase
MVFMAVEADEQTQTQTKSRRRPKNTLNDLSGKEWIKKTKSWLVCDSRRYHKNRDTELHPARYPEELVAEFIQFFTKSGQWVLDPFAGSGATMVACEENDRCGVGIELCGDYVQMSRSRLAEIDAETSAVLHGNAAFVDEPEFWQSVADDAPDLPINADGLPIFDFIMTSPPYWNMLRKSRGGVDSTHKQRAREGLDTYYSDRAEDLGNIPDYDDFIEALGGIFDRCARVLRPDGYMAVVVQNIRVPEGHVRPMAWDLQGRISETLSFQGERIWCQDSKKLGIWGYPTVFVPNYHHHYCLIFQNK